MKTSEAADCPTTSQHYPLITATGTLQTSRRLPVPLLFLLLLIYGVSGGSAHALLEGAYHKIEHPALPTKISQEKTIDSMKMVSESEMDDRHSIRYYYPEEIVEANSGLVLSFNLSRAAEDALEIGDMPKKTLLRLETAGCGRMQIKMKDPEARWTRRSCSSDRKLPQKDWVEIDVTKSFNARQKDTLEFLVDFEPFIYLSKNRGASLVAFYETTSRIKRFAGEEGPSNSTRASSPSPSSQNGGDPPKAHKKGKGRGRKGQRGSQKDHHSRSPHHRKLCQRVDLYVDFKELNWDDWILSPMGYNAYMCVGECPNPLPAKLNATNHAIVQSLINSLNPDVPGPCCVATETSALNILYRDLNDTIVIKKYEGMRVDACGCR